MDEVPGGLGIVSATRVEFRERSQLRRLTTGLEKRMALNIKSREVEALAGEVARIAGESKTEAIRKALAERRQRLLREMGPPARAERLRRFFAEEIWPLVPPAERGRPVSKREREEILGYGEEGI
jgi:antitoxin VapB